MISDRRKERAVFFAFVVSGLLASTALSGSGSFARAAESGEGLDGGALFHRYCASCHGVAADGKGAVASSLRTAPSDLRQLWKRYGTPLAVEQVTQFVDGRQRVAAHGDSDMPVWGLRLKQTGHAPEPTEVHVRDTLRAIIVHLDSIQDLPADAPRPRDARSRPEPR